MSSADDNLRCKLAQSVAQDRDTPRLIESQPVFHPIAISLEADTGISRIVVNDLAVEPSFVAFEECER